MFLPNETRIVSCGFSWKYVFFSALIRWFYVHFVCSGITMYAVGVGKAIEDELRVIASDPVEKHFFYSADFTAISQIAENLKFNVCAGESEMNSVGNAS